MFTQQADALPLKKRALRGRRLVAVDIENVVGGSVRSAEQVTAARRLVIESVGLAENEQVVIGTGPAGALTAGLSWPAARLVMRAGADGADRALLDVLLHERVEERFDTLVLVSGDGIFAEAVAALGARGVHVTVVARVEALSKRLQLAAAITVRLNESVAGVGGAA